MPKAGTATWHGQYSQASLETRAIVWSCGSDGARMAMLLRRAVKQAK